MKFGKLENGKPTYFKNPVFAPSEHIFTNDKDILLQYGFKEIVYTDHEEREGYYPIAHWEETETQIAQNWSYEPIAEEPSVEDYRSILFELGVQV